jgi:hypothetical protein
MGGAPPIQAEGGAPIAGARGTEPPPKVDPPPPPACEEKLLAIDALRPSVTLLVDQSGSMNGRFPTRNSEETRWSIVRRALLDEQTGVVRALEQSIQFGLAFYTSHNGFSSGVCPILSQVHSSLANYDSIRMLYDSVSPDDDTPTGAALLQIVNQIRAEVRRGPNVVLLVTDGDPDNCDVPDPQTEEAQLDAVRAASAAYAADIGLYVLGISADISGDKLQQLANAGQGRPLAAQWGVDPDAAQPFQASGDVLMLTAQLREILAHVPLCEVALSRDIAYDELATASVLLDGVPLAFDPEDGFDLSDPRHLRVMGRSCELLREKGQRLSVRISCP